MQFLCAWDEELTMFCHRIELADSGASGPWILLQCCHHSGELRSPSVSVSEHHIKKGSSYTVAEGRCLACDQKPAYKNAHTNQKNCNYVSRLYLAGRETSLRGSRDLVPSFIFHFTKHGSSVGTGTAR